MTIRITRYTVRKDATADEISAHTCPTLADFAEHLAVPADSAVVRCDTDEDFYGLMSTVRRVNDKIADPVLDKLEPGAFVEGTKVWQFKSQSMDGTGWRMLLAFEPAKLQKPLPEGAKKSGARGSALEVPQPKRPIAVVKEENLAAVRALDADAAEEKLTNGAEIEKKDVEATGAARETAQ